MESNTQNIDSLMARYALVYGRTWKVRLHRDICEGKYSGSPVEAQLSLRMAFTPDTLLRMIG
jgi:hypothetical protein